MRRDFCVRAPLELTLAHSTPPPCATHHALALPCPAATRQAMNFYLRLLLLSAAVFRQTYAAWYIRNGGAVSGGASSSVWHGDYTTPGTLSSFTFEVYNDGPSNYYGFNVWTSCSNVRLCYGDGSVDYASPTACRAGSGNTVNYGAIPKNQDFSAFNLPSGYYPACIWIDFSLSQDGVCDFSYIMKGSASTGGAAPTPYYVSSSPTPSRTATKRHQSRQRLPQLYHCRLQLR